MITARLTGDGQSVVAHADRDHRWRSDYHLNRCTSSASAIDGRVVYADYAGSWLGDIDDDDDDGII